MINEASVIFRVHAIEHKLQAGRATHKPLFPKGTYTGHVTGSTTSTGTGYQNSSRLRTDSSASHQTAAGNSYNGLLYAHNKLRTSGRQVTDAGSGSSASQYHVQLISGANKSVASLTESLTKNKLPVPSASATAAYIKSRNNSLRSSPYTGTTATGAGSLRSSPT